MEAIGVSCFNGSLLCVEYVEDLDIVSSKCESNEVFGIGLDEMFGDGVIFGHVRCLASDGVSAWDTRNSQTQSKWQAKKCNPPKIER